MPTEGPWWRLLGAVNTTCPGCGCCGGGAPVGSDLSSSGNGLLAALGKGLADIFLTKVSRELVKIYLIPTVQYISLMCQILHCQHFKQAVWQLGVTWQENPTAQHDLTKSYSTILGWQPCLAVPLVLGQVEAQLDARRALQGHHVAAA